MDFDKRFHITPEETQKQINHLCKCLTQDKACCVCANSNKRLCNKVGYRIETTWCRITGEYMDYKNGNGCPNWKAAFPRYEEK